MRAARSARGPLSPRVLLGAGLLIPANAWWLTQTEFISYSDNATTQALFFNAIALLLLLLGLNRLLLRLRPGWIFSSQEIVALYLAVVAASGIAGHDTLQILFSTITYPAHQALVQPGWGKDLLPLLPPHLVVTDREAIQALFTGNSTLYRWDHIRPWLAPLGWWTLFVMMLVWVMLCLTTLFRRQWENERLAYPIAELPVHAILQERTLFRQPLLWIGFAIGASFQVLNLLHVLFPAVPAIPTGVTYYQSGITPWRYAGSIPVCTYAFAYGLTFLLPTQLGFSVWFFFLISRLEMVGSAMFGYAEMNKFPYVQQQGVGAILGFFLALLWAARGHLKTVWQKAIGRPGEILDDSEEPLSYRTAVFGFFAGILGLVGFATGAGMRPLTAILYLLILLIVVLVVARLRAELGLPTFELYLVGGDQVLPTVAGGQSWTRGDYTGFSLFFFLTRTHRQFPMQNHVDAMHIGKRTQTPLRSISVLILAATGLGILAAFWAFLHSLYIIGFLSAKFQGPAVPAFGRAPWDRWDHWVHSPMPPDQGTIRAYLFGAAFTLFLSAMRSRFVWWPFHPAGYLVAGSFGLFRLWLPIFVSWLIKVLVLRYGGLRAYRQALPFFIGLVFGEFTMGFIRSLLQLGFGINFPAASGIGGL